MTKAELFSHLQALPEFDKIIEQPQLQETNPNGDKLYRMQVRMVAGYKVSYIHAYFWVEDEELPTEKAWYWDREPVKLEDLVGGA